MLLLLFFIVITSFAHCSKGSKRYTDPIVAMIEEPKTLLDCIEVIKTAQADKPLYPHEEHLKDSYYKYIKSCLKFPHQLNFEKSSCTFQPDNSLLKKVLIKNSNTQLQSDISKTRLYYALKYENTQDIYKELERYNHTVEKTLLERICSNMVTAKERNEFYTKNYQTNFQLIRDLHNKI